MAKHILLFIYNSFEDPIVQGSVLTYIDRYKSKLGGQAVFTLITFEQEDYKLSEIEIDNRKKQLAPFNIEWMPLKYHSGGVLILLKKLYDLINSIFLIFKLDKKRKIDLIYTVGTVGGSLGYILSKFINTKLLVHTFEPHSEFMMDFGIWQKNSISFRMLHFMEKQLAQKATYLMTGTDAMINRIKKVRLKNGVFKVPSCVDLDKFKPLPEVRMMVRNNLRIRNKLVLLYVGKFGGIYFKKEPFIYFKHFLDFFKRHSPYVLIISPNDKIWIRSEFQNVGIEDNYSILNNIPFDEIQNYINAGDIAYCGIPPLPSQKYRSPIKNGEYLACGLPYIVYEGVSEDDIIAKKEGVGVVLKNNSIKEIIQSLKNINTIIHTDRTEIIGRCLKTAYSYRGIQQTDKFFFDVFK